VLYDQPKVNMRFGTAIGYAALIRRQHPDLATPPPAHRARQGAMCRTRRLPME